MAPDCIGPEVAKMRPRPGEVLLLENLRFHAEEETNEPGFAKQLASLADVYVNDACGSAHRAHASTVGMIQFMKEAAAGLLMDKELEYLGKATLNPERPCVAILGGAMVSDKIEVIQNLMKVVDRLLIGGAPLLPPCAQVRSAKKTAAHVEQTQSISSITSRLLTRPIETNPSVRSRLAPASSAATSKPPFVCGSKRGNSRSRSVTPNNRCLDASYS